MLLFWCKLYFYHITSTLAEFWVKWTPLVAWVDAQPLFLAYIGLNIFWHKQHTYALITTQPRVFLPPKYHQHTYFMLLIDTGCWNSGLENVEFWPILAPLLLIFSREMTQNAHLTNHWVFSLQFFFNHVCLLQEHQNTKNHVIWCSGWSGVDIWLWKVGFTPQPIRHGHPDVHLSSSGAVKSLQAGLPSDAWKVHVRAPMPWEHTKTIPNLGLR